MEWIILSGSILVAGYFIYAVLQRRNDIQQKDLDLKQKQVEQKERELELNPEYRQQKVNEQLDSTVATGERQLEEAELKLKEAQEHGDRNLIKEAKNSVAYSRDWLKTFKAAREKA